MTEIQAISPAVQGNRILKFVAFLYGLVAYLIFFVTILYAIGFVDGTGRAEDDRHRHQRRLREALVVNLP